jgi:CRP-like cAMP-binding protein
MAGSDLTAARERPVDEPRAWASPVASIRTVSLLELDPELAEDLPRALRTAARGRALARVESFPAGPWTPGFAASRGARAAVFLAEGLVVREARIETRSSAELLGAGDVVYPWHDSDSGPWASESWRAILPGRAALLDEALIQRIAPLPALTLAIAERSARRGRFLAALGLTRRMRRVEDRLLFVFALLAERWGRVRPDGIHVSLPLTHELLGELIGAHRQTVTSALGALRASGLITQLPHDGWLLDMSVDRPGGAG